jgi:hypothetical protein
MSLAAERQTSAPPSANERPRFASRFGHFLTTLGRRAATALVVLAVLLVAVRAALPWLVERYVNRKLDEIPGYRGRIADVDLSLWRGAYTIEGLDLVRTTGKVPVPFFTATQADLSVEWKEVFHGALVGEIEIAHPKLNFVAGPTAETSQTSVDASWQDRVRELFPLRINRFEILDGEIHYRDLHAEPKVDVSIDRLHAVAKNLTNSRDISKTLVATIDADGRPYGESGFRLHADLDPYRDHPTFNVATELERVDLRRFNDFMRAYGNFDVEKGVLNVYTEVAAADGRFTGYVKPLIEDLDIVDWSEKEGNVLQRIWESLVGATAGIFRNHPKDRWGTRVAFSGSFDDPQYSLWGIIGQVLKNTFVKALPPRLEGSVSLEKAEREAGVEIREEGASEEDKKATAASKLDRRVAPDAERNEDGEGEPDGAERRPAKPGVLGGD